MKQMSSFFIADKEAQVASALFHMSSFLRSSLSVIFLTSPEAVDEYREGVPLPKWPRRPRGPINRQPAHCQFCQYSAFITLLIQSIAGTIIFYCERWPLKI